MAHRRLRPTNNENEPAIRFREEDLVQLREICDTIYSLYDLIRDREDSVPMACLLRPMVRTFGRFVEGLDDRFEEERERKPSPNRDDGSR